MKKLVLLFFFIAPSIKTVAHGGLHKRILEATQQIKCNPDSAFLYVKRGTLYRYHGKPKKSLKDYFKAKRLGYSDMELEVDIASSYFAMGKYKKALYFVEGVLSEIPNHVGALALKARTFHKLDQYQSAAIAYEEVLKYNTKPTPENYIVASEAWRNTRTEEGNIKFFEILHQAIETLGPLNIFYANMVDWCIEYKAYQQALLYQTKILDQSIRKEKAYYDRAMLYVSNTQIEEAKKDLLSAKKEIADLPSVRQNTKAIRQLVDSINSHLKVL